MAYPFFPAIRFDRFKRLVSNNFQCICNKAVIRRNGRIVGSATYIQRNASNGIPFYLMVDIDDKDRLTPQEIVNFCKRLQIDADEFGKLLE